MEKIAFVSGKGGVGKSVLSLNIAVCLAAIGKQVVIMDANFGMASLDVLAGLTPRFHLGHVIWGNKNIPEVMVGVFNGVNLIPASSGLSKMAELSLKQLEFLTEKLANLTETDFLLMDCAPGIGKDVVELAKFSDQVIVVTMPEPTAIVDSYAAIKCIWQAKPEQKIGSLVNRVEVINDGKATYCQINSVAKRFIGKEILYTGFVQDDYYVGCSVREQALLVKRFPRTEAANDIRAVAKTLISGETGVNEIIWPELISGFVN